GQQLDEGHVADFIQANKYGVVEDAVGQTALRRRAGAFGDVEVRERVTVLGNHHAGAAAGAAAGEDRDHRRPHFLNDGDALGLVGPDPLVGVLGIGGETDGDE